MAKAASPVDTVPDGSGVAPGPPVSETEGKRGMDMIAILIFGAGLVLEPGPIDGFRANYAATKVDLDFRYRCGFAEASAVGDGRLWEARDLGLKEKPEAEIAGHWSCDGSSEAFRYGSPEAIAAAGREGAKSAKPGRFLLSYIPAYEGIYDGEYLAGHYIDEPLFASRTLAVDPTTDPLGVLSDGTGPYCWWPAHLFPAILSKDFGGIVPTRGTGHQGGHAIDQEIYRRQYSRSWKQIEVYYDPAMGYLPRYARLVVSDGPMAVVREFYLIEAKPCTAGGFVPIEWYVTALKLDKFASRHPDYKFGAPLEPEGRTFVGHFRVTRFADRRKPVELDRLAGVSMINAPGGQMKLNGEPRSLTLSAIRSLVGGKMAGLPPMPMPTLDVTELHQFDRPTRSPWGLFAAVAGVVALLAFFGWRRARSVATALILVSTVGASGCGQVGRPVAKLSASIEDPTPGVPGRPGH